MFVTKKDIAELLATKRPDEGANTRHCVKLLKEFLRREVIWAQTLGILDEVPLLDLAAAIQPDLASDDTLAEKLKVFTHSWAERTALCNAIHWANLYESTPAAIE
jgi:hypothetical protein